MYLNGDTIVVLFAETKTTSINVMSKIIKAWEQVIKDVNVFYSLLPDLQQDYIEHIEFKTVAVLPECDALTDICHNCLDMVILRTDLTKEVKKGN